MKCIIAIGILTFVVAVHSSVIPISPLSLVGPTLLTHSPGLILAHQPTIAIVQAPEKSIAIHASTAPAAGLIVAQHILEIAGPNPPHTIAIPAAPAPAHISIAAAPAPAAVIAAPEPAAVIAEPAPAIVAAEGQYLAKTRGSEHSAPLPGHINSASSINLEPAPGTL